VAIEGRDSASARMTEKRRIACNTMVIATGVGPSPSAQAQPLLSPPPSSCLPVCRIAASGLFLPFCYSAGKLVSIASQKPMALGSHSTRPGK
jgi:hypothetical protein